MNAKQASTIAITTLNAKTLMAPTSVAVNQDFKETENRIAMVRRASMAMNSLFQKFGFFLEKEILRKKILIFEIDSCEPKKIGNH